ncbi:putative phosphoric monoester hydrolase [Rosa chinensis]|uniref:protein-tyrosine-phosphatase n=1 Tax=Rosa chinensis TaxID=74649 RepID=A0A2P6SD18_ROSCH|nr:putative phosphoric monoester hydrolase [Rosa chinensis]
MLHLVRENLFIGNITDAVDVLQNGSATVTHILSVLSSASISFFSEYKKGLTIPTKEITKVYAGGGAASASEDGSGGKLLYLLEYAGKDLKLVRMGVPVRDMESENLLDYLEVCLDFIDKSRKEGSVLVHCFAGLAQVKKVPFFGIPCFSSIGTTCHVVPICLSVLCCYWDGSKEVKIFHWRSSRIKLDDTSRKNVADACTFFGAELWTFSGLYCSYHYSISYENRTVIARRYEQIIACLKCCQSINLYHHHSCYILEIQHNCFYDLDALGSLRQSCEFVCPNDGFLNQLKMYEDMGFKVDHASPIYKSFRLKILGESYYRRDKIDSSKFGADPGLPSEVTSQVESSPIGGKNGTSAFRCKKCRRLVAVQDNVVDHIPGQGETSFEWLKRKSSNYNNFEDSECSSIFVEPLKWMTAVLQIVNYSRQIYGFSVEEGAMEGKLSCAHCEARLGYFNWSGIQCSCGSWITPAFQLHRSQVDMSSV